jgi:hypothetical protein
MMTYTNLKMLFWMLLFLTPPLSAAEAHVADTGSLQPAKTFDSEPAAPISPDYEDDDCD